MSNLPEHTDHQQRSYQANIDKIEFNETKNPRKHGKGRPYMVTNDKKAADKLVLDAINETGCNYA